MLEGKKTFGQLALEKEWTRLSLGVNFREEKLLTKLSNQLNYEFMISLTRFGSVHKFVPYIYTHSLP
jgi:hypothetical protein